MPLYPVYKIKISPHSKSNNMATTKAKRGKPKLIIERSDSKFFGRVTVNNNLIIDHADSIQLLNRQLKKTNFTNLKM
jgi:hypothetical protein